MCRRQDEYKWRGTPRLMQQTVGKWRKRFLARRVDGMLDEPRPGVPRTVNDAQVEEVVRLTLETKPRDATHWEYPGHGSPLYP
jgi:hypothetical protein